MKIRELLDGIKNFDLVLPEFQREYVWTLEQAKQLIVSLFKEYPTGSLLFWKTNNPPEIKNNAIDRSKIGTTNVILDGQQRLTTFSLLIVNSIPPYYKEEEIKKDPRHLYFDLKTGEFQYYQKTRMESNPSWVSVTKCFKNTNSINVFEIAKQFVDSEDKAFEVANIMNQNLNRLRNIQEKEMPIQYVPSNANIDNAIDVFDKVNSMGTKLTDAELALAHICGKWPLARQVMKNKINELGKRHFWFDLTFMARALTVVVTGQAMFEKIHFSLEDELKDGWKKVSKILDYLINILPQHAFSHSTHDVNSNNIFIPLVMYLSKEETRFPDIKTMNRAIQWLYYANIWARYTSQTDQKLDQDISIIKRDPYPWDDLKNQIIDQRGRLDVKPDDFEGRSISHPLYKMIYILCKANGATDWFNGSRLDNPQGSMYSIHNHHIFPKALLYSDKIGYSSENHIHKKIVNDIANLAFLTGDSNIRISDAPPTEYLPKVDRKFPGAIEKQYVPNIPALWQMEKDKYILFLKKRRELLAKSLNSFLTNLVTEPEPEKEFTLDELIETGESTTLEFKGSIRWDFRLNQVNKVLEKSIVKTIAAFLNTSGGILVIGVSDEGDIWGIENDLQTLKRKDLDGYENYLTTLVGNKLGVQFTTQFKTSFINQEGRTVCIVKVTGSSVPVYLKDGDCVEFYVRSGNTSRQLNVEEVQEYIPMNW